MTNSKPVQNTIHNGKYYISVIFNENNIKEYTKYYDCDGFWTPTSDEIDNVEKDVIEFLSGPTSENIDNGGMYPRVKSNILDSISNYKCQYIGIYRKKEKLILCNYFHENGYINDWKNNWVIVMDGGYWYWGLRYNFNTKTIEAVVVNQRA